MIRTFKYRFAAPVDPDAAPGKVKRVALNRCRLARGLYGVDTQLIEGTSPDLEVTLRIGGHNQFEAAARARKEIHILARVLRMGPNTVTLVEERAEPSMRNLTVEQGRVQSYAERTATRLRHRAERLRRFREENEEWLAPSSQ